MFFYHKLHFMSNVHTLYVEKEEPKRTLPKYFCGCVIWKKSNSLLFKIFKEWFQNSWQYIQIKLFRFLFILFLENDFNICIKKYIFSSKKYFCILNRKNGRLVLTFPKSAIFRNIC